MPAAGSVRSSNFYINACKIKTYFYGAYGNMKVKQQYTLELKQLKTMPDFI